MNQTLKIAVSWLAFLVCLVILETIIFKGLVPMTLILIDSLTGGISNDFASVVKATVAFVCIFVTIQLCYFFLFKNRVGIKIKKLFIDTNKDLFKK